eukprot:1192636-Rhodomonas_salina.1
MCSTTLNLAATRGALLPYNVLVRDARYRYYPRVCHYAMCGTALAYAACEAWYYPSVCSNAMRDVATGYASTRCAVLT